MQTVQNIVWFLESELWEERFKQSKKEKMVEMTSDKGNSWSLSKCDIPVVSNDFNAPVNDSIKLTVHLKAYECASRSSMHGQDD